ncbi:MULTISPECIES: 4Fe-4S binding protein [Methanoculleus]|uniref:4Fe-4S binding domain-containing protein n=1 Tax=Methanoculleus thermophilus TaxID=2200 RepID=A0A1G8XWH3_9EURY|nr:MULTISPECIES: 4Fe-4S binding protein [Methanoculleus]NLN07997.1 4Fe-4S binding protein [Methanoculleus thermophilus]SDJ94816.1 4Fe-4S binding domain-containing protein [Methanoculleus thermophilus]HQD25681.1 4Fe-4S binding protein [Methanoculleus thermophilus]
MKRKIIEIDEEKCTGCGLCIPDCPEGALQIIDGKARLVSDLFCDGLGACVGTCPEGAICVVEREAGPYDERAVMARIVPQGEAVIKAHLEHLLGHGEEGLYRQAIEYLNENNIPVPEHRVAETEPAACPGTVAQSLLGKEAAETEPAACPGTVARSILAKEATEAERAARIESALRQWPIQLTLVNPAAGYFDDADLLVSGDCVPFAYPEFHRDFLRGKIVLVFCPKLDADVAGYVTKLAEIFSRHTIRSITVMHMEVPCCGGVRYVVDEALKRAGKEIPVSEYTVTLQGEVVEGSRVRRRGPGGGLNAARHAGSP